MFSKTVFSIARSTFRMYSVMAILKSSIVWGIFLIHCVRCTETFWSHCSFVCIYVAREIMFIACFSAEGQLNLKTLPDDTSKVYKKKGIVIRRSTSLQIYWTWLYKINVVPVNFTSYQSMYMLPDLTSRHVIYQHTVLRGGLIGVLKWRRLISWRRPT